MVIRERKNYTYTRLRLVCVNVDKKAYPFFPNAMWRGMSKCLFLANTLAPRSSRNSSKLVDESECPLLCWTARWSGVLPSMSTALISAPACSRICIMAMVSSSRTRKQYHCVNVQQRDTKGNLSRLFLYGCHYCAITMKWQKKTRGSIENMDPLKKHILRIVGVIRSLI